MTFSWAEQRFSHVRGRAWDTVEERAPAYIVIADAKGVVEGLGHLEIWPSAAADPTPGEASAGWHGLIDAPWRPSKIAYGVLADGQTICRLEPEAASR